MKTLLLFRGTCGSGKTTLRKNIMTLAFMPGLDMADKPYDMPLDDRVEYPARWIHKNAKTMDLWMEGIFAWDSPSLTALLHECRQQKRVVQMITTSTTTDTLRKRLKGQPERLRLALKYANRFN